jgi:hypothetical protein
MAIAKFGLAGLYLENDRTADALPLAQEAMQTFIKLEGDKNLGKAVGLFQNGVIAASLGFHQKARGLFQECLDLAGQSLGRDHEYLALVLHELAVTSGKVKDGARAEKYYRDCLQIARTKVGLDHPKSTVLVTNFALFLASQKEPSRREEANQLFQELLAARGQRYGEKHPLTADALRGYAEFLGRRGYEERQKQVLGEAVGIYRQNGGPRYRLYTECLNNLAMLHLGRNDPAGAERLLQEALPLTRKQYGPKHKNVAIVLANLAAARLDQRKYEDVEPHLLESLAIYDALGGTKPRIMADPLIRLHQFYCAKGRVAEAAAASMRRRELWPADPDELYDVARELTRCAALAARGAGDLTPAQRADPASYADQGMATLRQAIDNGYKDLDRLRQDPDLAPLRERREFKELLQRLEKARPKGA